jgi:PAS domain S-box-containing protein
MGKARHHSLIEERNMYVLQELLIIGIIGVSVAAIYILLKRRLADAQTAFERIVSRLDAQDNLLTDQRATLTLATKNLQELAADKQATLKGIDMLAEERHLLRTLIDALPDLIYIKDTDHRFVLANAAFVQYLNLTSIDALIGKTDLDVCEPDMANRYYQDECRVLETGQPLLERIEPGLDRQTNLTRWFLTTKAPFHDQQGNLKGILGISRDITKLKQAEDALEALNQGLEQRLQRHV